MSEGPSSVCTCQRSPSRYCTERASHCVLNIGHNTRLQWSRYRLQILSNVRLCDFSLAEVLFCTNPTKVFLEEDGAVRLLGSGSQQQRLPWFHRTPRPSLIAQFTTVWTQWAHSWEQPQDLAAWITMNWWQLTARANLVELTSALPTLASSSWFPVPACRLFNGVCLRTLIITTKSWTIPAQQRL